MKKQDNLLSYRKRRIINKVSTDEVKVIPNIEVRANIYINENYPREISFTVEAPENEEMSVKLCLEMPFEEKHSLQGTSVKNGGTVTAALPDISEIYGVFYLDVSVENADGDILCEQTIPFSHLRVGAGKLKHCGASIHALGSDLSYPDSHYAYDTIDTLALFGSGVLRDEIMWQWVEKEKGNYEFTLGFGPLVDYAIEKGIVPHIVLDYSNPLYDDGKSPITEEGYEAFATYCAKLAEYFKGRVYHYEVWNEYNSGFSREEATPGTYAKTVKAVSKAVKAVDPSIKITAGVTVGTHHEWIRRMLSYGIYDYIDEVSIHPYSPGSYPDENQGGVETNAQSIRDIISEFGEPKPVWASEIGWTVYNNPFSFDREEQAAAITRLFAITESSDSLEKVTMYDIRNDGSNALDMEPNWGMIEFCDSIVPFCAKESLAAAANLNWLIGDGEFVKKNVVQNIKNICFSKDGKTVNCIWSLDGAKKVTLELNGECDIYNMYGTLITKGAEKGSYTLEINECPIYYVGAEVEVKESGKPDKLIYDFPYTLSAVPVLKEDGWYISALVHSHSRKLHGMLRIELPELRVASGFTYFDIKDGEKFSVETKVGEVDVKKLCRALVEIRLDNGESNIKDELVSFLSVPYGDRFTEIVLNTENDYVTIGDATPIEAEAKIRLSYNEEALTVAVDVTEETHIQYAEAGDNWKDLWDGDGIEMMIQPLYDGNREITKYNQIGLGLSSFTGQKVPYMWESVSNRASKYLYNWDFDAERNGNVTSYKIVIKWADILPPNVTLSDCDSFGFAVKINKTDDPEDIKGFLALYRGIGWWKPPLQNSYLPCEFGRFVLEKTKQ